MQHLLITRYLGSLTIGSIFSLNSEESKHIVKVLRMKIGYSISISDLDGNNCITEIDSVTDDVKLKVISLDDDNRELPFDIHLYQGMPKSDKLEFIIQKSVELGAKKVIPVDMIRSIAKTDSRKIDKKIERYQSIADNASNQSKRQRRTDIEKNVKLRNIKLHDYDIFVVPYEMEKSKHISSIDFNKFTKIGILVGPEGGIADEEVAYLKGFDNVCFVTLGNRILRTETASITTLSYIMLNCKN